ncbi:HAD-superfamily hydrolase, subfamily IA, variant 3 [Nitratidesulfovibrio vulgaris DP4]|jgi:phosphoglycolate phosphatase|uniref:phosphoglycolate phosphatase n=2 Tax=Nitratidesulfovibrio vulgaris TaxID=881 RepID=A0A0H3AB26_NITV4|nr:HAD-superfamily hydrolase, subfamily IA, variant 3 [Nitratidesulfovibrio vulgaris DP4]
MKAGMNIRACIFDLDGTLLDTLRDLAEAGNAALMAGGHPAHPVDAYRHFVGDGMETLLRRALPPGSPEEAVRRGVERMGVAYRTAWDVFTAPYPGIMPMLEALGIRGIPMAVLSNKPHPFTVEMVEHYFGPSRFGMVAGAKDDVPRKPHPEAALRMASAWGIAPSEIAFVGDSNVDMRTALAAGMVAVGCPWGFRGTEELKAAGAHLLLEAPGDLLSLVATAVR